VEKKTMIKNPMLPHLPRGKPTEDEAVAVVVRIINEDGTIVQLLDPMGNSKEKHQALNKIFLTIQGHMMPPTFIAPSSTSLTIFS
jgi:hypothetical protein